MSTPATPTANLELTGIHHVSAMTADVRVNRDFYTRLLGMRLVKKTVNQDDVSVYHLFYADGGGHAGTDVTFFDFPNVTRNIPGSGEINEIVLRVTGPEAIAYWQKRFEQFGVPHEPLTELAGHTLLRFTDPEGQRLALMDDGGDDAAIPGGEPWDKATVPVEFGIRGLGAISITTGRPAQTLQTLTDLMGFRIIDDQPGTEHPDHRIVLLETGNGGPNGLMVVHVRPDLPLARLGKGGVHHVAFRVPTFEDHDTWNAYLKERGIHVTDVIDRFYFRAMYFREPGGVLYEISSDGPGFATDEAIESLGESLALPPFLEPHRSIIEQQLRPLDTRKSVLTAEYGQPVKEEVTA
jgi:glyoxalase family protein